jgi:hypothetical protein
MTSFLCCAEDAFGAQAPPANAIACPLLNITATIQLFPSLQLSSRPLPLMQNIGHANLHYGNLVTYLRMMGLTPPSS